jgi:hypothetical protein
MKSRGILTNCLILLIVGISFNVSTTTINEEFYDNPIYTTHAPIYINGNDNISGPFFGRSGINYTFCLDVIDPEGDSFFCLWDWGDGTNSGWLGPYASGETICASHTWQNEGTYTIRIKLKDEYGSIIEQIHIIMIEDKPPYSKISRPKRAIYVNDQKILPFFVPVIFGDIQLWIGASDEESGLNRLELYIDNDLKEIFTSIPKSWTWSEQVFFRHKIKIVAYDNAGNTAIKVKNVWKFS